MDNTENQSATAAYNPNHGLAGGGRIGQNAQTTDRPPSELDEAIADNSNATTRVAELTAVLHDRLTQVMRSPVPTDEKRAERSYGTSRAGQIAEATRNLNAVADILGSMLDRLEV